MARITALIPARGGSKGVPGKNIRYLHNYPLIAYSIAACKMCKNINKVIVSTDDKKIAEEAKKYGAEVPFIRPKEFAEDRSTDFQVVKHFFDGYGNNDLAIAYVRPTTPIREPSRMDKIIEKFYLEYPNMSGMRTSHELSESPYKMYRIKGGFYKGFFEDFNGVENYSNLPRQIFPKTYHPNGYLDFIKADTISKGSTYGDKIFPIITKNVVEIDTEYEFDIAKILLEQNTSVLLEYLEKIK